jgi:hypothetical protein
MTLDVKALLKNLLKKQMSIQHFTAKTDVFAVGAVPKRIKDKIKEEFGDQFLLDANYVVFFRGDINKDGMKKLFNLTNKAFGEDANRLVEGDFKRISFATASSTEEEPKDDEEPENKEEAPAEEDVDHETSTIDDEVDEIVNEGKVELDEDVQIDSSVDAYVFLKITTK